MKELVGIYLKYLLRNKFGWKLEKKYGKNDTCDICMEECIDNAVFELPCSHVYHAKCIMDAIKYKIRQCPKCLYGFN